MYNVLGGNILRFDTSKKYVLGGGISGLIFAFYNPEFQIVSNNVGGRLANHILEPTILLHDDQNTRKLITDLGLKTIRPLTHVIKYYYNGEVHDKISPIVRELMVIKKLTSYEDLDEMNFNMNVTDTMLSYADCYIPKLEVNKEELVQRLVENVKIINDKVVRITKEEIVTENSRYEYDELVSTIDAPQFWDLYNQPHPLDSLPVTFVTSDTVPLNIHVNYNLMYFVDPNIKFSRVNLGKDGKYLYEFTGRVTKEQIKLSHPEINIQNYFVQEQGIVISDLNNIPPEKVKFIGRFAKWDHHQKINNVIAESIAKNDFVSVWNKQKQFSSHFFDFNVKDPELQQKLSKEYVLHITDEAHEFLSQINWKMQKYRHKPIDRQKLIEEWIDIGKFWMGLGNIWGIELDEFFREFWRKSDLVDRKFEHDSKSTNKNHHDT